MRAFISAIDRADVVRRKIEILDLYASRTTKSSINKYLRSLDGP